MSPAQAVVASVKHDQSRLQGNVAKDVDTNARAALQAAEASLARLVDGGVVDVLARNRDGGVFHAKLEVRGRRVAGEDVAAVVVVEAGALDLVVVGRDNVVGQQKKRGSSIGDASHGLRVQIFVTDGVAGRGECPPSLAVIDLCVNDGALVLRAVNVSKVICAIFDRISNRTINGLQVTMGANVPAW